MIIGIYSPQPQSGKTTVAMHLCLGGFLRLPFATTLKAMVRTLLKDLGYTNDEIAAMESGDKKEVIRGTAGSSLRFLYQTLGTEWGREHIHEDLWANVWSARAEPLSHGSSVVADDMRFENEARAVRELGGQLWKVVRPGLFGTAGGHVSEGALEDNLDFDRIIVNDGTLEDLRRKVDEAIDR